MRNKGIIAGLILMMIILSFSGCLDFFTTNGSITYQSHPTKISYTISYGYRITCTGSGQYEIDYNCDEPEVLKGQITLHSLIGDDYETKTIATYNRVKSWDINDDVNKEYNLGITASVVSESYTISDLRGEDALAMPELKNQYPDIVEQYTQAQSNETTVFIDPENSQIKSKAFSILLECVTNNPFLLARELFRWLKQETTYQIHLGSNDVQPAETTFQCKTGDCDDLSYLYISLCRSIGIPARFIRGFLVEETSVVPHAWAEVFVGGDLGNNGWIPVECAGVSSDPETQINQNFGLESADHLRLFTDDGSNESLIASLSGLTYVTYGTRSCEPIYYSDITDYAVLESNELVIDENNNRFYQ